MHKNVLPIRPDHFSTAMNDEQQYSKGADGCVQLGEITLLRTCKYMFSE